MTETSLRDTVLSGGRGMVAAVRGWVNNPWRHQLNRYLWGRWWWLSLGVLVALGTVVAAVLPPVIELVGYFPPLLWLVYLPQDVTQVLWSGATAVGVVIAWRCRRLRTNSGEKFPQLVESLPARHQGFNAIAVPVATATVALALASAAVSVAMDSSTTWMWAARIAGESVAVVALVVGTLTSRRQLGSGLGALVGASFSWWIAHMVIGFVVPYAVSWWHYLPIPWLEAPGSSVPHLAHLGLDLGVGLLAWARLGALVGSDRFWGLEPPPPPPPPQPAATTAGAE